MSMKSPSFSHLISGLGLPLAAQSRVTFVPSILTVGLGIAMNSGAIKRLAPSKSNEITDSFIKLNGKNNDVIQRQSLTTLQFFTQIITTLNSLFPEQEETHFE